MSDLSVRFCPFCSYPTDIHDVRCYKYQCVKCGVIFKTDIIEFPSVSLKECYVCGKKIDNQEEIIMGYYVTCSEHCARRLVGA